jgi:protein CMS1
MLGSLSTKALRRVIIDASHVDQKRRGIIEMKDTHKPMLKLLTSPALSNLKALDLIFY